MSFIKITSQINYSFIIAIFQDLVTVLVIYGTAFNAPINLFFNKF